MAFSSDISAVGSPVSRGMEEYAVSRSSRGVRDSQTLVHKYICNSSDTLCKQIKSHVSLSPAVLLLMMPPLTPSTLEPFHAIRQNWPTLKPYYEAYLTTISLASVLTAFLGTLSLILKHGLTLPVIHPLMLDLSDLSPSRGLTHPNEYISVEELAKAKAVEWGMSAKEAVEMNDGHNVGNVTEQEFKDAILEGLSTAMDNLAEEGVFNATKEERAVYFERRVTDVPRKKTRISDFTQKSFVAAMESMQKQVL
jgi:hypothetical protein